VPDAELGFVNYNLFRLDRNPDMKMHFRGGDVLIAVKNSLLSRELRLFVYYVEQIFIDIHIGHKHLIIGTVYIPSTSDISIYDTHCRKYYFNIV